ncbi:MAG TPA: hypothetical protein VNE82_13185 [Candidatus Binataceae bacterium]|nr:hypothetical protein [Candidatus Binataceae bacterium]
MSTSSFRVLLPSLAAFVMVLVFWPATGRADAAHAPGTESSAGTATDAWLVARGLIGHDMVDQQSGREAITPPTGVEVDETRQTENRTGQLVMQTKAWNEKVGDDTVHIEITILPSSQFEVGFWLFPDHRQGCTMYRWTLYDHGRALQSSFWRNDAAVLRLAGAVDLPHDLYPDAVPWMAFLRPLGTPSAGAEGILNQQITPYSYVGQDVWAESIGQLTVPAGTFSALKIVAQVDIATVMPNWPRFILHVIKPAIPKNTLYFDAKPPYRLLKQEGTTFVGGPEVTTELIRFYIAGAPPPLAVPAVAALGSPSIAR